MAINVFLQSVHNSEMISTFFIAEGELVNEIIALVEGDRLVPENIRTLALKAIAVQVRTSISVTSGCKMMTCTIPVLEVPQNQPMCPAICKSA